MAQNNGDQSYVVVTIYTPPTTAQRASQYHKSTRTIVHTYGPYTQGRAQQVRKRFLEKAVAEGYFAHFTAKISRIIDPVGDAQFDLVFRDEVFITQADAA